MVGEWYDSITSIIWYILSWLWHWVYHSRLTMYHTLRKSNIAMNNLMDDGPSSKSPYLVWGSFIDYQPLLAWWIMITVASTNHETYSIIWLSLIIHDFHGFPSHQDFFQPWPWVMSCHVRLFADIMANLGHHVLGRESKVFNRGWWEDIMGIMGL